MQPLENQWPAVAQGHAAALESFIQQASAINDARWLAPTDEGKWSPAEITEHVRLVYEVLHRELTGGEGLAPRVGGFLRAIFRRVFLPRILKSGRIARKVRAPKEIVPLNFERDRNRALARLREDAERFEKTLAGRSGTGQPCVSHHLFGSFDAETGLRFVTIHLENHRRQLPS
jgi:hypothetical protein